MGLHDLCRNPYHRFDKYEELVMEYDPIRGCHYLWGICSVCGRQRLVRTNELRRDSVVKWKLRKDGISKLERDAYFRSSVSPDEIYTVMKHNGNGGRINHSTTSTTCTYSHVSMH